MVKKQYVVAIELGSSKIVGALAEKSSSGILNLKRVEREDVKNSIRYGLVQNIETAKACVSRILTRLATDADGQISSVFVGLSGRSVHSVTNEINRPLDPSRSVTAEDVKRVFEDAGSTVVDGYEIVDVVPRSYAIDKQVTTDPVGFSGSQINVKVNLIVAKSMLKLNLERVMSANKVDVKKYVVTPLAVSSQIMTKSEMTLGSMLVDMGAETTTVAIFKSDALYYLATLPLGGRNISLDIANGMSVLEEDAERVKKNLGNPLSANVESTVIDGINSAEASQYVAARVGEIVANITKQISDSGLTAQDIKSIVLVGGAAQMNGLAHKIEELSKVKVRLGEQPTQVNFLDHNYNRAEYIELFSILACGAEMLGEDESCIVNDNFQEAGHFEVVSEKEEEKPEPKPEKTERKKNNKFQWMQKWTEKMKILITEDDENI